MLQGCRGVGTRRCCKSGVHMCGKLSEGAGREGGACASPPRADSWGVARVLRGCSAGASRESLICSNLLPGGHSCGISSSDKRFLSCLSVCTRRHRHWPTRTARRPLLPSPAKHGRSTRGGPGAARGYLQRDITECCVVLYGARSIQGGPGAARNCLRQRDVRECSVVLCGAGCPQQRDISECCVVLSFAVCCLVLCVYMR